MDIFVILLLVFLGYRNGTRAKLKGQNPILWGVITVVAYLFTQVMGTMFVILVFCRDIIDMHALATTTNANVDAVSKQFQSQMIQAFNENPLRQLTVFMSGLGGYLFVRYLLDRKPNKKEPEIHWMDKIGQDNS